jgi:DNA-binding beta-propeller fold protein YncE
VHGIAVDPTTRRVYVNDRNGRVQVFDENGKFLDQWDFGPPAHEHSQIYMGANHILGRRPGLEQNSLTAHTTPADTSSIRETFGTCQGCQWGVHGFATDKRGI